MPPDDPDWSSFLQSAFLTVLEAADEGLIVFDGEGHCRMIGRRAGEMFGVEPAAHVGRPRAEVLAAFAASCEEPDAFLQAAAADAPLGLTARASLVVDVDVRRPRPRTVQCKGVPIGGEGLAPVGSSGSGGRVVLVRDVTRERATERQTRQLQARIAELSPFDTLTGLLNARRFHEELEREHGRSTRAWDSYALLRLDVDGMQAINEEHGVPVGDQVLEQIASHLKTCLREYDVLARIEGDEFGVLLPGADTIAARAVGERMASAIAAQSLGTTGAGQRVTLSVGGALWVPPSGETGEDILRRAGSALGQAQKLGSGHVHVEG